MSLICAFASRMTWGLCQAPSDSMATNPVPLPVAPPAAQLPGAAQETAVTVPVDGRISGLPHAPRVCAMTRPSPTGPAVTVPPATQEPRAGQEIAVTDEAAAPSETLPPGTGRALPQRPPASVTTKPRLVPAASAV